MEKIVTKARETKYQKGTASDLVIDRGVCMVGHGKSIVDVINGVRCSCKIDGVRQHDPVGVPVPGQ